MSGGFRLHEECLALSGLLWAILAGDTAGLLGLALALFGVGAVLALVFDLAFAVFLTALILVMLLVTPRPPRGLTHEERRWVVRSVLRGEAPPVARLAPAVITLARTMRRRSRAKPPNFA